MTRVFFDLSCDGMEIVCGEDADIGWGRRLGVRLGTGLVSDTVKRLQTTKGTYCLTMSSNLRLL